MNASLSVQRREAKERRREIAEEKKVKHATIVCNDSDLEIVLDGIHQTVPRLTPEYMYSTEDKRSVLTVCVDETERWKIAHLRGVLSVEQ